MVSSTKLDLAGHSRLTFMAGNLLWRFVRRLQVNSDLDRDDCEAVTTLPWKLTKRRRHSYVLREGDLVSEISILLEGFAERQKHTGEGARQIVSFAVAGDPLDLDCLFLGEPDFSVQMCTEGVVASVRAKTLNALIDRRPRIGKAITTALLADGAVFAEWIVNTGRRDARQRIAHLLCEILSRLRTQDIAIEPFELPFTQEQLADATGLTSVHVNRVLRQLTSEGAIRRDRRFIHVPDWDLLVKIADFDPRFLHIHERMEAAPALEQC